MYFNSRIISRNKLEKIAMWEDKDERTTAANPKAKFSVSKIV